MKFPDQKKGMYFEGDIGMSADALIQMFGDDAHARVIERVKEMEQEKSEKGRLFWQAVADEISLRLKPNKG